MYSVYSNLNESHWQQKGITLANRLDDPRQKDIVWRDYD